MSIKQKFDAEKALEVLLYIAETTPNTYWTLKVLYFADKQHLSRFGRLICGDSYVAMRCGPRPSGLYDFVKYVRGDGYCSLASSAKEAFSVQGDDIHPHRPANREFLSESDMACLDEAVKKYGSLSFLELRDLSHEDEAFNKADWNDFMPLEAIIRTLPDGKSLLEYLQDD